MTLRDALRTSVGNLSAHKLRTGLAMLGVVFGVGAVISMLSIGAGAEDEALAVIQRLGLRNILLRARDYDEDRLKRSAASRSVSRSVTSMPSPKRSRKSSTSRQRSRSSPGKYVGLG